MDPVLEVKKEMSVKYRTTGSGTEQACPDAYLVTDAFSIDPSSVLEAAGRRRRSASAVATVRENFAQATASSPCRLSPTPNLNPNNFKMEDTSEEDLNRLDAVLDSAGIHHDRHGCQ